MATLATYSQDEIQRTKRRFENFYFKWAPESLANAEKAVTMLNYTEEQLIGKVCKKYNVDPIVEKEDAIRKMCYPQHKTVSNTATTPTTTATTATGGGGTPTPPPILPPASPPASPTSPSTGAARANATTSDVPVASLGNDEKRRFMARVRWFYKAWLPQKAEDGPADAAKLKITEQEVMSKLYAKYFVQESQEVSDSMAKNCHPSQAILWQGGKDPTPSSAHASLGARPLGARATTTATTTTKPNNNDNTFDFETDDNNSNNNSSVNRNNNNNRTAASSSSSSSSLQAAPCASCVRTKNESEILRKDSKQLEIENRELTKRLIQAEADKKFLSDQLTHVTGTLAEFAALNKISIPERFLGVLPSSSSSASIRRSPDPRY